MQGSAQLLGQVNPWSAVIVERFYMVRARNDFVLLALSRTGMGNAMMPEETLA